MPSSTTSVEINAAPERVWDMLTALRYLHLWLADVTNVQAISAPNVQAGTLFEIVRGGARAAWTVSEWQPPQQLRFSTTDGDAHYEFALEPTQTGTLLTMTYRRASRGLGRLLPATSQRRLVQPSLARFDELIRFNRDIVLLHGVGDE